VSTEVRVEETVKLETQSIVGEVIVCSMEDKVQMMQVVYPCHKGVCRSESGCLDMTM
jgi:hypothetical protein